MTVLYLPKSRGWQHWGTPATWIFLSTNSSFLGRDTSNQFQCSLKKKEKKKETTKSVLLEKVVIMSSPTTERSHRLPSSSYPPSTWIKNSWAHREFKCSQQSGKLKQKEGKKIIIGFWHVVQLMVYETCMWSFQCQKNAVCYFISSLQAISVWDVSLPWTITNHPFMWIKRFLKNYPASQS